jgi:hypothetical protein
MRSANTSFVDGSLFSSFLIIPTLAIAAHPHERFPTILQDEREHQKAPRSAEGAAKRLIKLWQSASAPRVSFETTEREAA